MAAAARRGRLSSIDLLPEEADFFVAKAMTALQERRRPQNEILEELNEDLAVIGLGPISKSAFNRKAVVAAVHGRKLQEMREIATMVGNRLGEVEGDVGQLLNETLKTLIYDILFADILKGEPASIAQIKQASLSLRALEGAKKLSVDAHAKARHEFAEKADEAIAESAKKAGLDAETVAKIRREVLGIIEN